MESKRGLVSLLLCGIAGAILLSCGAPPAPRPVWMDRLQNVPEVIEGKGFAPLGRDKKAARDAAYNDALQKLILASEVTVKGQIETHLVSTRDLVKGKAQGEELLDNVNKTIYDTVLDRKFFEEYMDTRNKEYWVYVYIPVSALSRIAAQESLKLLKTKAEQQGVWDERMKSVSEDLEKDIEKNRAAEEKEAQMMQQRLGK